MYIVQLKRNYHVLENYNNNKSSEMSVCSKHILNLNSFLQFAFFANCLRLILLIFTVQLVFLFWF